MAFLIFMKQKTFEKEYVKANIEVFYQAADTDGNAELDLEEFITFLRPMDPI